MVRRDALTPIAMRGWTYHRRRSSTHLDVSITYRFGCPIAERAAQLTLTSGSLFMTFLMRASGSGGCL